MKTIGGRLQALHCPRRPLFSSSVQATLDCRKHSSCCKTHALRLTVGQSVPSSHMGRALLFGSAVGAAFVLNKPILFFPKSSAPYLALEVCADQRVGHDVHKKTNVSDLPELMEPRAEYEEEVQSKTFFSCGRDLWLRPTLVARPCMHQIGTREDSLQAVQGCMETMQQTVDRLPTGEDQILVLYDLGGAKYRNFDMLFTRELIQGLLNTFPDRLQKVLVFNGHWSLRAAWSTISRLLHPETRQKVVFCNPDLLLDYVDARHPYLQYLLQ